MNKIHKELETSPEIRHGAPTVADLLAFCALNGHDPASVEVEAEEYYDSVYLTLTLVRDETPEESAARERNERVFAEDRERQERAMYEALSAKYGNPSSTTPAT